jgi:N utilization substance protein A
MARKSAKATNQNKEFFEAIAMLEQERGIPADYLLEKVCAAIITSVRKEYGGEDVVFVDCDAEKSELRVYLRKTVVEVIENDFTEILPEEAVKYKKNALVGDIVEIPLETKQFGRIAATTAKNVIRGDIHDAERGLMLKEFESKQKELVTGKVQSIDPQSGNATLEIGKAVVVLPK